MKAWESKNAKRALQGAGLSTMAVTLAACGGSSDTATTTTTPDAPVTPVGQTFTLTDGIDALTGTAGDDTFIGDSATVSVADSLNGGAGTDRANLFLDDGNESLTSSSVEHLYLQASGAARTFDASNVTGATEIWSNNSSEDLTVTNVANLTAVGVVQGDGANGVDVNFVADVVSGASDEVTVALQDADAGTVDIDGVETFNVSSGGTSENELGALTGDDFTAMTVSGAQDLTITTALAAAVASVDASAATGDVSFEVAGDVDDADETLTVSLGSGDDTLNTGAVLDDGSVNVDATVDLDGGDGTDILAVDAQIDSDVDVNADITNFEVLQIEADVAYDLDGYDWVKEINLNADIGAGGARVIDNIAGTTTTNLIVDVTDAELSHVDAGAVGVQSLSMTIGGDAAVTATMLTIDGVENITIESTGEAANTITAMENDALRTLTITGDQDLTITAENISDSVAASAFTGDLDIDLSAQTDAIAVETGSGDDLVTIDAADLDAHEITFNAGEDTLEVLNISGGAVNTLADRITISDFVGGEGGDVLDFGAGQLATASELSDIQDAVDGLATGSSLAQAIEAAMGAYTEADEDVFHFQFDDNTYVVFTDDINDGGGADDFSDGDDYVVELTGTVDLTADNFVL